MLNRVRIAVFAGVFVSLILVMAAPQAAEDVFIEDDPAGAREVDQLAATATYFTVRRDLRKCASPMCGGYFVKRVNHSRTLCSNGRYEEECYVADIDWRGQPDVEAEKALLRGHITGNSRSRLGRFGKFRVSESWQATGTNPATKEFFRVRDRGIRCITFPCLTHNESRLNSTFSRNIAGIDLTNVGASADAIQDAGMAMSTRAGILVSGSHKTQTGPAGRGEMLVASQFYLRARKQTSAKPCMKTGCSGQVCSDEEVVTTCEYRPEYDCYKTARCERQANGQCGFTPTKELTECLNRRRP